MVLHSYSPSNDLLKVTKSPNPEFPAIRSGSSVSVGGRLRMEDEHFLIDDLSTHISSTAKPISLYGVYDGHGGCGAAIYARNNVPQLLIEDSKFLECCKVDQKFLKEVGDSLSQAYLKVDQDLANEPDIGFHMGTTALTAVIIGRHLTVANTGDCRAVLSRKGEAINMSIDHRPIYPSERKRVKELGSIITHEGYLDGVLSVSRALGDWDMKCRPGPTPSPLIPDPDIMHYELTEDDEFLIMACDGVWDVMTSQAAVNIARCSLNKHDSPEQCAKDLVKRALVMGSLDNLTVVVVCFTAPKQGNPKLFEARKIRWSRFGISTAALCSFKRLV